MVFHEGPLRKNWVICSLCLPEHRHSINCDQTLHTGSFCILQRSCEQNLTIESFYKMESMVPPDGGSGNGRLDLRTPFPKAGFEPATLVDLLRWRASHQPGRRAYTFLGDGEAEESFVNYGELDRQARAIATRLQTLGVVDGERTLLFYPTGLQYVAAFLGCLYAGVVAVPAYPPRLNRPVSRLQAIAADSQATVAL